MLQKSTLNYSETGILSKIMKDYLSGDEKLKPFYGQKSSIESFGKQIELKSKETTNRKLLVKVLQEQNRSLKLSEASQNNIALLELENTFTVTTGHQLCLLTGPLYFLYKIITTINLAEQLTKKHPNQNFVPIYWMASEDHDFEEVSFLNIFGKKVKWESDQSGAVGSFKNTGLGSVSEKLKTILGESENAKELLNLFESSYLKHTNLTDATRYLVNELFGKYGLVIIDGNNSELKKQFLSVAEADIFENKTFEAVQATNNELKKHYKLQINPRKINFFYLSKGVRERIVKIGERYEIKNTDLVFTETELRNQLKNYPERFSPNVVLRPLYQETILPNLAYIGGGGELGYWVQLKSAFESYNLTYPILALRNSALLVSKSESKKISKLGLEVKELFNTKDEIIKTYLESISSISFTSMNFCSFRIEIS